MEQARYWMWIERKQCLRSHVQRPTNLLDKSWEEQAFAEDSTGPLGGCIWPPRSYSCSFCRRDFRSAQALGGHMNVHRRERARLKQSPNPHTEVLRHHHNHQSPCTSVGAQHQPQVCTLVYDPNPNSNPSIFPSPLSRSTVSVLSKENCSDQTLVCLSYPPSIVQEHPKGPLFSDSNSDQIEGEKDPRIQDEGCRVQGDYLKHDLAVSLDLVIRQNRPSGSGGDEEAAFSGKRRRSDASSLPFFLKPSLFDRHHIQSDLPGYCPSSVEDIDLELRLGDRPKVK